MDSRFDGLYIGLMSGTSIDSIDAALVNFQANELQLVSHYELSWPDALKERLRHLTMPGDNEIDRLGELDQEVANHFAHCTNELIRHAGVSPKEVRAIGSHGQTVRHRPDCKTPFTLQIGDPSRIAERTGITVIADFRRRDMAAGGQGAPLVPAFHADLFYNTDEPRAILNIGGIANLTLLPIERDEVSGFDTGPGNTLMDHWARENIGAPRDEGGQWAAKGEVIQPLLDTMLEDPYFSRQPPKSTGPEYFSGSWLNGLVEKVETLSPEDVQATLTALTAESLYRELIVHMPECKRVIACGGGVENSELMRQISARLSPAGIKLETTANHGLPPDQVEAAAFAWLAKRTLSGLSGNLPRVTGARHNVILGGIFPA